MELATAFVGVELKDKGLVAQAAAAGKKAGDAAGDALEKELDTASKSAGKKVTRNISDLGHDLRNAFAVTGAVLALKNVIGAASDLNEEVSKSKVIFGEANAAAVREFAKGAEAIGQSEYSALQAAGSFAVFGKAAGLAGQDLVDFSLKSDQLASDLSSFFNTSPEQAIQAIGAAFRGESEPIRAYGVLLNDASLKQEALDEGLIKTTSGTLPQAARVQAAYGLIMKQTTDAQGDFARTADGVANSSRVLAAQFENTKASLGQSLLPVFSDLLKVASLALTVFDAMPGPVKTATVALLAFAAVKPAILALGGSLSGIGTSLLALPTWVAPVVAIIGGLSIIMADLGSGVDETTDQYKDFSKSLRDSSTSVEAHTRKLVESATEGDKTSDAMLRLGLTQDDLYDAVLKSRNGAQDFVASLYDVQKGSKEGTEAVDEIATRVAAIQWSIASSAALQFNGALQTLGAQGIAKIAQDAGATEDQVIQLGAALYDGSLNANQLAISGLPLITIMQKVALAMAAAKDAGKDQKESATAAVDPNNELFKAVQGVSNVYDAAADAAKDFSDALDKLLGPSMNLAAATDKAIEDQQGLQQAFTDARKGIEGNTKTLDEYTAAGRANREVISKSVGIELDYAKAFVASGGSSEEATLKIDQYRQGLIEQAVQSGLSADEVAAYIDQLGLTPDKVETAIKLAELEQAKKDVQGWIDKLNDEPGSNGIPKDVETAINAALDEGDIATAKGILAKFVNEKRTATINVALGNLSGLSASIFGAFTRSFANLNASLGGGGGSGDGGGEPERAHGGPVTAGRLYRVNEYSSTRGPEFFVPNSDGQIVPLGQALDRDQQEVGGQVIYAGITVNGTVVDMGDLTRWADERDRKLAALIGQT